MLLDPALSDRASANRPVPALLSSDRASINQPAPDLLSSDRVSSDPPSLEIRLPPTSASGDDTTGGATGRRGRRCCMASMVRDARTCLPPGCGRPTNQGPVDDARSRRPTHRPRISSPTHRPHSSSLTRLPRPSALTPRASPGPPHRDRAEGVEIVRTKHVLDRFSTTSTTRGRRHGGGRGTDGRTRGPGRPRTAQPACANRTSPVPRSRISARASGSRSSSTRRRSPSAPTTS